MKLIEPNIEGLRCRIYSVLDEIREPCTLARDIQDGLVSLGLVESVDVSVRQDGIQVKVMLAVPCAGCLTWIAVENWVLDALSQEPWIDELTITRTERPLSLQLLPVGVAPS